MNWKTLGPVCAIGALCAIFSGVASAQATAPAGEPIKIGTTGAMTGPYSEFGTGMRKAAELAH